ncbi:hypothetical protein [Streptomyces sp. NPDC020965]|uniref:hypothetical protein n=1 Tax=Streptomyces sp. NPDC020965 TaxID=3365105 RepID=UPI00378D448E
MFDGLSAGCYEEVPEATADGTAPGARLVRARVTVQLDDPFLAGHYPGFPLVPGFALVQYAHDLLVGGAGVGLGLPVVLRKARFRSPVRPGEELVVTARITDGADGVQAVASVSAADRPAAEFSLHYPGARTLNTVPESRVHPVREPADVRLENGAATGSESGGDPAGGTAPDTARITSILPHRRPALLVDRVTAVAPGRRLVALKTVTAAEPTHRGLGGRAAPGLLLESWAQAAVLLACWDRPNPNVLNGLVTLLAGVRGARVRAPVHPGSVLVHEVHLVRDLRDTVITAGGSTVDGRPVLEIGQLTLALRPAAALTSATTNDERS